MNIVSSIASHIPYLRRFARALTGTQASGDAYVAATLEAVVEGTGAGDPAPTRLTLFRAFLRIWGSIPVNKDGTADPENRLMQTTHSRLEAITPLPRVAFLLNALEGFNTEEMAPCERRRCVTRRRSSISAWPAARSPPISPPTC